MLRVTADRVAVTPRYYEYVAADGRGRRVEIPASEYDPADPNMTSDANAGALLTVTVPVDRSVETAAPWGVEPLFAPRSDRRPTACDFPAPDWLRCYEYDSAVYASYGANATAYRDVVSVELRGPQDGWSTVTATLAVDTERRSPPAGRAANASA